MPYFVYILKSRKNGKYYVGSSKNVELRLFQHNAGYSKSTKNGVPWELKLAEEYESLAEAMNREAEIKKMKSRKWIEELLERRSANK